MAAGPPGDYVAFPALSHKLISNMGPIMTNEHLRELAEILEYDGNPENSDEPLSKLPNWDSVAILGVISLAENLGNSSLTPESFHDAETVGDVTKLVFTKGVNN